MKPETAIKKLMAEIEHKVSEGPGVTLPDIKKYLWMFGAVCYDNGTRSRSNQKAVIQLDKYGNVLDEFESAASAARSIHGDRSNIANCCNSKTHSSNGSLWKWK